MNDRYTFACVIARKAGALALDFWNRRDELVIELKGPGDFVSVADREVENLLRRELAAAFPDDRFLGEETAPDFSGQFDRTRPVICPAAPPDPLETVSPT